MCRRRFGNVIVFYTSCDTSLQYQYQYQSQIYLARASFFIKNAIGGATTVFDCWPVYICHIRVLYPHGWRHRKNSFSFMILVTDPICRDPNPRGTPPARALNTLGGENLCFQLKWPYVSETVRDRPMVAMEC